MKNQFVGDINEYYKYSLLRLLSGNREEHIKVGICWMLTPDEGLRYLDEPTEWLQHDPDLFHFLEAVKAQETRSVARIEASGLLPSPTFDFFREPLQGGRPKRQEFFAKTLNQFSDADLIFFDPDTGLAPSSERSGQGRSAKYLYPDEATEAFGQGHSILLYQHFARRGRANEIKSKAAEISEATEGSEIWAFRPHGQACFLLAAQAKHREYFRRRVEEIRQKWAGKMTALLNPHRSNDGSYTPGV